jgi:two-component system sensor histidine kinase KdpD
VNGSVIGGIKSERALFSRFNLHLSVGEFLATLLIVGVSSGAGIAARPELGEVASALIFVLGITFAGALCGLAAALLASIAAFLLFNFYLAEPILTFRLASGSDVATLLVFNLCAVITGVLAGRLNDQARAARLSNGHLAGLLATSEALQSAVRIEDVAAFVTSTAPVKLGLAMDLFQAIDGELRALSEVEIEASLDMARFALIHGEVHEGAATGRRLNGSNGPLGVMVVAGVDGHDPTPEFSAALGNVMALALERAALSRGLAERRAAARTEELKTALLSSVSHDFRTPLTAISASASSLIEFRDQLDPTTSAKLLRGIVEECERLNRFTANLLEMSRLEVGQGPTHPQVLGVADMIGAVISRVRMRAGSRKIVKAAIEANLLVLADAALFELVLVNVMENAILYSDDDTQILVSAIEEDSTCVVVIADEGEGIPARDLDRVFERFVRVSRAEASPHGSGLGLAIARGFVEALGGKIFAEIPGINGRGTRIVIRLPLAEPSA